VKNLQFGFDAGVECINLPFLRIYSSWNTTLLAWPLGENMVNFRDTAHTQDLISDVFVAPVKLLVQ